MKLPPKDNTLTKAVDSAIEALRKVKEDSSGILILAEVEHFKKEIEKLDIYLGKNT